jgi:GAF domain-containing protein
LATIDAVQYLDGGPCVDAAATGAEVHAVMDDPLDEERWRMFSRAGAVEGVASSLSLPIYRDDAVVGGVNLYASTDGAFEGSQEALAALLGASAAEAVSNADLSFSTRLEAAAAPERMRERIHIDTAVGLIAAQRRISVEEAHDHLVQAAARAGVPEVVVARVVVVIHTQDGPA